MQSPAVSIIHGARRLFSRAPNRVWMRELAAHLEHRGFEEVECFDWSGSVLDALVGKDAERYAIDLRSASRSGAISIVSKSMGAIVVEQALAIAPEVRVDLLIRVGVPDRRRGLSMPNVGRIVNVTSSHDQLDRLAARLLTPLLPKVAGGSPTPCQPVELSELSHRELTSAATFQVYYTLLTQDAGRHRRP